MLDSRLLVVAGLSAAAFFLLRRRLHLLRQLPRTVTLTYFDCKGRGEALRLLLADQLPAFIDRLVDKEQEWSAMKKVTPCGGLPMIEMDGLVVAQNVACAHVLGQRLGLMGCSDAEHARCSMVLSMLVQDLLEAFTATLWAPVRQAHAWDAGPNALIEAHCLLMEQRLHALERLYAQTAGPFLLVGAPSVPDYYALYLACILREAYVWSTGPPPLDDLYKTMLERPAIARHVRSVAPPRGRYTNSPAEDQVLKMLATRALRVGD